MVTNKDDYGYIATFIDFLRQIIEIIKGLFSGLGSSKPAEGEGEGEGENT